MDIRVCNHHLKHILLHLGIRDRSLNRFTGELFTDYEQYIETVFTYQAPPSGQKRIVFRSALSSRRPRPSVCLSHIALDRWQMRQWTCALTGKTGLTYEEAQLSERLVSTLARPHNAHASTYPLPRAGATTFHARASGEGRPAGAGGPARQAHKKADEAFPEMYVETMCRIVHMSQVPSPPPHSPPPVPHEGRAQRRSAGWAGAARAAGCWAGQ